MRFIFYAWLLSLRAIQFPFILHDFLVHFAKAYQEKFRRGPIKTTAYLWLFINGTYGVEGTMIFQERERANRAEEAQLETF